MNSIMFGRVASCGLVLGALAGCSDDPTGSEGAGGAMAFEGTGGGALTTGGAPGAGGVSAPSTGGAPAAGGLPATGGAPGAGGTVGSGGAGGEAAGTGGGALPPEDFEATAADFECVQNWTKVRNFRIENALGKLDEAIAVANSPTGGRYPVGTIIQLVPIEAMVKRLEGFSPETNDWEFFFLNVSASGTQIVTRGTTDVVNQFNGNCFDCHSAAEPQFDLVCETGRGCAPLPVPTSVLVGLQDTDPRCP